MASALFKDLFLLREHECSPPLTEASCTVHVPDLLDVRRGHQIQNQKVRWDPGPLQKQECALSQRLSHPSLRLHTFFIAFLTKRFR